MSSQLIQYRQALEKLIPKDRNERVDDEERILDIFKILENYPVTVDMLKESKIGKLLDNIKKNYPALSIGIAAKKILKGWKSSILDNSSLPENRRKMRGLFSTAFKALCTESSAKDIANQIEDHINQMFSFEHDSKAYLNKGKSLLFNLKINEHLKRDIIDRVITPQQLVSLSASELADTSVKKAREEMKETSAMARRNDIYQVYAEQVREEVGSSNEGEFRCPNCNGTKTSHSSVQIDPSDEPMTTFINCSECGNRWKI